MSTPRPPNFVASTTWSRREPRTSPRARSEPPPPPYVSDVSNRVIPTSIAASTTERVRSASWRPPELLRPGAIAPPRSQAWSTALEHIKTVEDRADSEGQQKVLVCG